MTKKIEFTKQALDQIKKITSEAENKTYFRIIVKGGGCSGFKYDFKFSNSIDNNDVKLGEHAIIDKKSLELVEGSIIDFKAELIGDSFVIKIQSHHLVVVVYLFLFNEDSIVER